MNKINTKRDILVYADWIRLGNPTLIGILHSKKHKLLKISGYVCILVTLKFCLCLVLGLAPLKKSLSGIFFIL